MENVAPGPRLENNAEAQKFLTPTAWPSLARITFPTSFKLHPSSCCPTMDLVALTSVSSASGTEHSNPHSLGPGITTGGTSASLGIVKVGLWRLLGGGKVWEWEWDWAKEMEKRGRVPGWGASESIRKAETQLFESGKGRGEVRVDGLVWSPDGQILSLVLSHPPFPPNLFLLSVHTGSLLLPPYSIPELPFVTKNIRKKKKDVPITKDSDSGRGTRHRDRRFEGFSFESINREREADFMKIDKDEDWTLEDEKEEAGDSTSEEEEEEGDVGGEDGSNRRIKVMKWIPLPTAEQAAHLQNVGPERQTTSSSSDGQTNEMGTSDGDEDGNGVEDDHSQDTFPGGPGVSSRSERKSQLNNMVFDAMENAREGININSDDNFNKANGNADSNADSHKTVKNSLVQDFFRKEPTWGNKILNALGEVELIDAGFLGYGGGAGGNGSDGNQGTNGSGAGTGIGMGFGAGVGAMAAAAGGPSTTGHPETTTQQPRHPIYVPSPYSLESYHPAFSQPIFPSQPIRTGLGTVTQDEEEFYRAVEWNDLYGIGIEEVDEGVANRRRLATGGGAATGRRNDDKLRSGGGGGGRMTIGTLENDVPSSVLVMGEEKGVHFLWCGGVYIGSRRFKSPSPRSKHRKGKGKDTTAGGGTKAVVKEFRNGRRYENRGGVTKFAYWQENEFQRGEFRGKGRVVEVRAQGLGERVKGKGKEKASHGDKVEEMSIDLDELHDIAVWNKEPYRLEVMLLGSRKTAADESSKVAAEDPPRSMPTILPTLPSKESLVFTLADLKIPPSLPSISFSVTKLRSLLWGALGCLEGVKRSWEDGKREGRKWMGRVEDLGVRHGMPLPISAELLRLLITGKPTEGMHAFLASPPVETSIGRWESVVNSAFKNVLEFSFKTLAPTVERILVILEDVMGHQSWTQSGLAKALDCNDELRLPLRGLVSCIHVAQQILVSAVSLEKETSLEKRRWQQFIEFMKYEASAANDSSRSFAAPKQRYEVPLVVEFITHSCMLPSREGRIDQLLGFAAVPLSMVEAESLHGYDGPRQLARQYQDSKGNQDKAKKRLNNVMGRSMNWVDEDKTMNEKRAKKASSSSEGSHQPRPARPAEDDGGRQQREDAVDAMARKLRKEGGWLDPKMFLNPLPGPAVQGPDPVGNDDQNFFSIPGMIHLLSSLIINSFGEGFESVGGQFKVAQTTNFEASCESVFGERASKTPLREMKIRNRTWWDDREEYDGVPGRKEHPPPDQRDGYVYWTLMERNAELQNQPIHLLCAQLGNQNSESASLLSPLKVTLGALVPERKAAEVAAVRSIADAQFYDWQHLIAAWCNEGDSQARHGLARYEYKQKLAPLEDPTAKIPQLRPSIAHELDPTSSPSAVAVNGRKLRNVGCVLSHEGRLLDSFEMAQDPSESAESETEDRDEKDTSMEVDR